MIFLELVESFVDNILRFLVPSNGELSGVSWDFHMNFLVNNTVHKGGGDIQLP